MYSKNPYTRSAFKQPEPSYYQYPQDDYYYQPQPPPYYQQPPPPPYYEQPYPSYHQQPQPSFYEQQYPNYHDQPYPPYQTSIPRKSFTESSLKPYSNYYEGDGMITDIEYLDFPADKTYKRTPLNQRTHNKIISNKKQIRNPVTIFFTTLLEQLNTERSLEQLKRKLVIAEDFHVPILFRLIDRNNTQNITLEELYQGFYDLGIKVDYNQLYLVYTRFSELNNRDRMSLQEFEQLFLPLGQTSKPKKNEKSSLGPQTLSILNELIKLYQLNEQRFENSRALLQREGIDMSQIYQMIDTNQSRNIGLNEFMNALNSYSAVKVVPSEAALLFMRFDRTRNGTISFMEFKREMEIKLT
ncbi:unnamed protein product [Paramecium pentaurelia]|uniref:EF-hand domain-containing protein n=1 Tax=Paramecium pentaurelia TaxID=43138 RepID=A0A8S1U161_9CILI|nr:unnamed protein product [Paramecium pentaurelia]